MKEEEYISAFVEDGQEKVVEQEFGQPEVFYLSEGYSMLFRVRRYGRIHLLKALKPEYRGKEFYERALLKEFQMGYQLEHVNIRRTLGWESLEGIGNCILLEYVDGITLKELMDTGQLIEVLSHRIVEELCSALSYIHSKQMLHRDLKPSNVMVTHNGQHVKLIDFSLADSGDFCVLKFPAGTPYYMAPEKSDSDARSDIYSLGVMMGEMARQTGDVHMRRVADSCTQPKPENRIASMEELLAQLKAQDQQDGSLISMGGKQRHNLIVLGWITAVIALVVLVFILVPKLNDNGIGGKSDVQMGQGNIALSQAVLDACYREQVLAKEGKTDTAAAYARIQAVLDAEYPSETARQGSMYHAQRTAARLFLDHLLKAAP
ncbi:MAG: serine/threonine protein kinase [Prevotella sp.]|nr:serine/threonine protein kinase [Prevotella sp.]